MCPSGINENIVLIKIVPGLYWMFSDVIDKIMYSNGYFNALSAKYLQYDKKRLRYEHVTII